MTGKIIDVHAHFVPDHYRAAAIAAGHAQPDGFPGFPEWSRETMLAMMDRTGIATAMLSISSPGIHFGDDAAARDLARSVNREGAALKAGRPDRFGHFASLPLPDVAGSLAEIASAFDDFGADGVTIKSNAGGLYPGDPVFDPIIAELNRRSAVVFLHPTSPHCLCCSTGSNPLPRPVLEFMFETTRAVTDLLLRGTLQRYPDLKLIVPHGGATLPVLADRVALVAAILPGMLPDSRIDGVEVTAASIMATLGRLYYDTAGAPLPRQLPALRTFADPARLLYGSDWPFTPEPAVAAVLAQIDSALVPETDLRDAIHYGNARRLFPRLAEV